MGQRPQANGTSNRFGIFFRWKGCSGKLLKHALSFGGLAGTDGAIILRTDLNVEGFGTEIVLDKVSRPKAFEVDDPMQRTDFKELDTEQMGMRHRSAIRLCGTDRILRFLSSRKMAA